MTSKFEGWRATYKHASELTIAMRFDKWSQKTQKS